VQPAQPCSRVGLSPQLADRGGERDRVLERRRGPAVLGLVGAPETDVHAVPRQEAGVVAGKRVRLREPGLHLRVVTAHGLHDAELVSSLRGHLGDAVLGRRPERLVEQRHGLLVGPPYAVHEDGAECCLRPC
jgi:hypothetical protein